MAATTAFKAVHGPYAVLLIVTVAVWAMSELRQLAKARPEATKIDWKDETVLRVAVLAGVAVALLAALQVSSTRTVSWRRSHSARMAPWTRSPT
jgi:hypothetical protein